MPTESPLAPRPPHGEIEGADGIRGAAITRAPQPALPGSEVDGRVAVKHEDGPDVTVQVGVGEGAFKEFAASKEAALDGAQLCPVELGHDGSDLG